MHAGWPSLQSSTRSPLKAARVQTLVGLLPCAIAGSCCWTTGVQSSITGQCCAVQGSSHSPTPYEPACHAHGPALRAQLRGMPIACQAKTWGSAEASQSAGPVLPTGQQERIAIHGLRCLHLTGMESRGYGCTDRCVRYCMQREQTGSGCPASVALAHVQQVKPERCISMPRAFHHSAAALIPPKTQCECVPQCATCHKGRLDPPQYCICIW
jgi:hypothetical protein